MNAKAAAKQIVKFYGTQDEYGCFSNFYHATFALNGCAWPTVEHYFQAQKFPDTDYEQAIRKAKSPAKAKSMGRTRSLRLRKDWERVKDGIMREAVLAKFTQHLDLRMILLSTGDAILMENSPTDTYWGIGSHGGGKNKLGKILMSVREELRASEDRGENPS
jgi:N-glycosidase YbiA